MCELPTNVIRAEEFLRVFDSCSIGSNDLTQLVLGIDRDSGITSISLNPDVAIRTALVIAAAEPKQKASAA